MSDKEKYHKTKKFLKLPHIHGGKEELRKFIKENLVYPEEALKNRTQGDVIIKYKISDKGEVYDPVVVKGIGHGCDQEALRLVKLIEYDPVKNRGMKVTAHNRIKIPFRIRSVKSQKKIQMVYTPKPKTSELKTEPQKPKEEKTTYTYTIRL